MNISIPYGKELHKKVAEALKHRKRMWHNATSNRRLKWKRDLENSQASIHVSQDDKDRKGVAERDGKPTDTQIEVP